MPVLSSSRPIVLVHGAWHGAWCWAVLQAELDGRGIASYAVDLPGHGTSTLPLGGLATDATHLSSTLDHLDLTDAVLVGHSYGGAVITQAAADRADLAHLVYVAAFALDDGESVVDTLRSFPRRDSLLNGAQHLHDDGTTTLGADLAGPALYARCPPRVAAAAGARLSAQHVSSMTEPISGAPRDAIASTYVRCARDEAVHPDHQDLMADRCTDRMDLDTDHSPFLSTPALLADILERIATP